MTNTIDQLQTKGVAMMPYSPELRELVERAAASWQVFCELPLEEKERYGAIGPMVGYEFKDNKGPFGDRKENFDITEGISINTKSTPAFISDAITISKAMSSLAIEFAQQTEARYGVQELAHRTEQSKDQIFTRFIHYFGDRTPGEEIATPHCDQSGFTFHLFETTPGCERLDYATREWIEMPVESGKMAAFPAMQLQLISNGELRALSHRVVATEQSHQVGRFAIVCFVRLAQTPEYNKAKYGRLQEFTPGFNYNMTSDEFSRLFV